MCCAQRHEHGIFICPAVFVAASVGYSLSVLATVFAMLTSALPAQPLIEISNAVTVSSPSSSSCPQSLRDKARKLSRSPSRTPRKSAKELVIDVDVKEKANPESSLDAMPVQNVVHFQSPTPMSSTSTKGIPTIAISPPPIRVSMQLDSSRSSTDNNTLSLSSTSSAAPLDTDQRGRRRHIRFSKIVHLFTDKNKHTNINRRSSLPTLPCDQIPDETPASPSSLVPLSPTSVCSPTSIRSPTCSSSMHSTSTGPQVLKRSRSLMSTVSCPRLHHSQCPYNSDKAKAKGKAAPPTPAPRVLKTEKKEPAPRPRTHPYGAPYFIPPPDAADVEEPFPLRRRRTTHPPERRLSAF
ncbi:hypothetical protein B0H10DRAFT_628663 [Mycena sp. CBHHK59/15]|nr:hypothetical protein B0H10DRAFT_628663 [Mycena sp. CBHHK59/15]